MNKKLITVAILSVSALFTTAISAVASETSTRRVAVGAWKAENKVASDTNKGAVERYKTGTRGSFATKKSINEKFAADVSASKAQTRVAVESATTAVAKKAAMATGESRLDAFITARSTAIASLTPVRARPNKATKPSKPLTTTDSYLGNS